MLCIHILLTIPLLIKRIEFSAISNLSGVKKSEWVFKPYRDLAVDTIGQCFSLAINCTTTDKLCNYKHTGELQTCKPLVSWKKKKCLLVVVKYQCQPTSIMFAIFAKFTLSRRIAGSSCPTSHPIANFCHSHSCTALILPLKGTMPEISKNPKVSQGWIEGEG